MEARNTSSIPCRFFAEGTCRQGDNCKFSHDLSKPQRGTRGEGFRGRGRGDFTPRKTDDDSGDFKRPYGQHSGPRQHNYGPREPYDNNTENSFENRGRGSFRGSYRGNRTVDNQEPYNYSRYEDRKDNFRDQERSFQQKTYNPPRVQTMDNSQSLGSKRIELLSQNDRIKQLNIHRQNNGIAKLFINEAMVVNNVLIMTVKDKNFILAYDLATSALTDSQIYINTNINDTILKIRKGHFGKLGSDFAIVGYTKFNEVAIKMSSYLLITPITSLFDHSNFITLEVSTEAAIDNVLISEDYLFVSCYNQSGLNSKQ